MRAARSRVTERAAYIGRVRDLARAVAQAYYESRERLGFPMLEKTAAADGRSDEGLRCWSSSYRRAAAKVAAARWREAFAEALSRGLGERASLRD